MEKCGTAACALNAANEVAVDAFLKDKIGFLEIADINESVMLSSPFMPKAELEDYILTDQLARARALELVDQISKR
jgi:1-deoxy-D-xylulose-5-phosphate reductoisomerase